MGTKEEIEKFLKDLQINPKYIVFNFNEGSQYDLEDIIQRALDHFKPQTVTSQEKLKEIREMIKYILPTPDCNDSEIVETYTETIMSIFSQDNKQVNNNKSLRIGGVILRDYLLTCRVEENGTGSGEFNHMTSIFEVIRDLKRSKSWYFKAAKNLEECDSKFWRACGTDICFYLKLSTTDYLLSSDENKKRLEKSIKQIEKLEPKAIWEGYCGCSDEEICEICFEEKGWIINEGIAIKDK